MNFNTANRTYRQLMGNGLIYSVPRFQRDYSWKDSEWDDLWQDIEALFETDNGREHYMGYLVLQSGDNKNFDVIDGQQRLTTLSLIILAILKSLKTLIEQKIDPEKNQQRLEQLRASFIGYLDPVTLIAKSKLNLNRNNDNLYQRYLVALEPAPRRNLKATEHLMRKAFEWFLDKVKQRFEHNMRGETLAQFVETISDKLFFTVITVNDELNAYTVFETLNARGVKLSSTDLLKNYLFSIVDRAGADEHEMKRLDEFWEELIGVIGSGSLPDFLRAYWNSKNKFVRHSALFKHIKAHIATREQVFQLVRDLQRNAEVYAALPNAEDDLWKPEQRPYIKLLRMFHVRQLYPLLLAAYEHLSEGDFTSLLHACCVISFRYNVIGNLATNDQERVYNQVAMKISGGQIRRIQEVLMALKPIYVSDDKFRNDFAAKELRTTQTRNKRIVRYVLTEIERHISRNDYDFESDTFDIEHIMPEKPENGWEHISDQDHEAFLYRLGNMTLLSKTVNRELGNAPFEAKRAAYEKSNFLITSSIAAHNQQWNPERIAERQRWMAKQATAIWRISQLD